MLFSLSLPETANPGLKYGSENTKELLYTTPNEKNKAVQIFGSEPEIMGEAAKVISEYADIIDINMGCPAPKVVKNGDGSKLLLNLDLVGQIVEAVVKAVTEYIGVPYTVTDNENYYKVKSGDTLGGIAKKYRVSVKNLQKWNKLSCTTIRMGQKLKIYK